MYECRWENNIKAHLNETDLWNLLYLAGSRQGLLASCYGQNNASSGCLKPLTIYRLCNCQLRESDSVNYVRLSNKAGDITGAKISP